MDKSMGDMKTMAVERDRPGGYTLSVDETLGQYRIVRPLGRGGMGEVYEAEHVTLHRRYALKLLPAEFAAMPGALERFRREARVMANLDHPHIVKVDDFGESGGRYWLRMELANGLRHGGLEVTSLQDLAAAGGGRFRLPTEAEWEYACRAGTEGPYAGSLSDLGWYSDNSENTTHSAGLKRANAWGLYDMHGNVWAWCQDWCGDYPAGSVTDPAGAASGSYRVGRGGSWGGGALRCRSAVRFRNGPSFTGSVLGLRVVLAPVP